MNINNIDNPLGADKPVDRNRDAAKLRAGRTEEFAESTEAQKPEPRVTEAENSRKDTFQSSQERKVVEDLTRAVEGMKEEPREDLVATARERVRSGYYKTDDVVSNMALRIMNIEPPSA